MNPWASGGTPFWGTGNPGAAGFIGNLTTSTDESVSGKAAKLETKDAVIKLGAGNIFTGDFALDGTNGILTVGRSFNSFPTALRFHYKYTSATINKIGQDVGDLANLNGRPDSCHIYIALSDKSYNQDKAYRTKAFRSERRRYYRIMDNLPADRVPRAISNSRSPWNTGRRIVCPSISSSWPRPANTVIILSEAWVARFGSTRWNWFTNSEIRQYEKNNETNDILCLPRLYLDGM